LKFDLGTLVTLPLVNLYFSESKNYFKIYKKDKKQITISQKRLDFILCTAAFFASFSTAAVNLVTNLYFNVNDDIVLTRSYLNGELFGSAGLGILLCLSLFGFYFFYFKKKRKKQVEQKDNADIQ
jgi:hypothetical protein